jgi:hypothetical protein
VCESWRGTRAQGDVIVFVKFQVSVMCDILAGVMCDMLAVAGCGNFHLRADL